MRELESFLNDPIPNLKGGENMLELEIFWDDLTPKAQRRIQKALNLSESDNGNWDVFPLVVLEFDEDAYAADKD